MRYFSPFLSVAQTSPMRGRIKNRDLPAERNRKADQMKNIFRDNKIANIF
jgi:hypothetical protein